jgi:hypothetical protein
MPQLDAEHVALWAKEDEAHASPDAAIAAYSSFKTNMPDEEKDRIDQLIAEAQYTADPDADVVEDYIIADILKDNGYHPAFEYGGVITAQRALERIQDERKAPKP